MPEPENNEAEQTKRRSQTKRELDAFAKLVEILKPFDEEQRKRLYTSALELLGPA